jgi:hypothetical protein
MQETLKVRIMYKLGRKQYRIKKFTLNFQLGTGVLQWLHRFDGFFEHSNIKVVRGQILWGMGVGVREWNPLGEGIMDHLG